MGPYQRDLVLVDGEEIDLWSAGDALVLEALSIVLAKHLPVADRCTHVEGHGGAKAAVRQVWAGLAGADDPRTTAPSAG